MSAPDPADLRLVAALADVGRTTVLDLAARAGVPPAEAAEKLLRLNAHGLRLVVGVEGDAAALRGWLDAQNRPPLGWGVPASAGWTRPPEPAGVGVGGGPTGAPPPHPPPPHPPAPPSLTPPGAVGDVLQGTGPGGQRVGVAVVEVIDTADALFGAAGHTLRPGTRAAIVHTEVTAGPTGYPTPPDAGLVLVLGDGRLVSRSAATLSSRPPFRGGVAPDGTDGGNTVFELDAHATISAVRWRSAPGAPALEWRV